MVSTSNPGAKSRLHMLIDARWSDLDPRKHRCPWTMINQDGDDDDNGDDDNGGTEVA